MISGIVSAVTVVMVVAFIQPAHAVIYDKCIHGLNLLGYPNITTGMPSAKTVCDLLHSHQYYWFLQHNDTANNTSTLCRTELVVCTSPAIPAGLK